MKNKLFITRGLGYLQVKDPGLAADPMRKMTVFDLIGSGSVSGPKEPAVINSKFPECRSFSNVSSGTFWSTISNVSGISVGWTGPLVKFLISVMNV